MRQTQASRTPYWAARSVIDLLLSLRNENVDLPQLRDDLLRRVPLPQHSPLHDDSNSHKVRIHPRGQTIAMTVVPLIVGAQTVARSRWVAQ